MLTLITFLCDSLERFHRSPSALVLNLLFPGQVPKQPDLMTCLELGVGLDDLEGSFPM